MVILGLAGAALVVLLLARRQWSELNSNDMGTMSTQWLAEYNSQHP
jgi:hypothetical protein